MLGRPASCAPVWKNVIAGSWLIASVCIDLMKQRSSATRAVCGSSSLSHGAALAVLGELELRRPRPGSSPAARSCRSAAGPCGPSRAGPCREASPAAACSRTGRSATGRRTGTGRSPAWPAARSAAGPASRRWRRRWSRRVGRSSASSDGQRRPAPSAAAVHGRRSAGA